MRTSIVRALSCAALAAGCASAPPAEPLPLLFPAQGQYELVNPNGEITGYVFAETEAGPGRQFLRWLLLDTYVPPHIQPVSVRLTAASNPKVPGPATAAEFADFARDQVAAGSHVTYAKSYADTFFTDYEPGASSAARKIVRVPIPTGRRPPDPPGVAAPESWNGSGRYQEIDEGTIGIKPGPLELPPAVRPLPVGGGGYLPPKPADPKGIIGMMVASPPYEEEHENWFIPDVLFPWGLENVTLLPFSNQASQVTEAPANQWVVVVVNSSYYPGFVPNDW